MGFLVKAERLPPFVCRLLGRKQKGWKPLSHSDIAKASGIARSTVAVLSKRKSWKGVPIDVVDRFTAACGVDLCQPERAFKVLARQKMAHLQRASPTQRRFLVKLLETKR